MSCLHRLPYLLALSLALPLAFPTTVFAQQDQALAKAHYLLRQVNAEKSQLESQLATQKAESESLKEELAALQKKLQALTSKSQSNAEKYQDNMENFREALAKERMEVGNLRTALQDSLNRAVNLDQGLNTCLATNKKFYELSQQLIGSYENKGFMDVMKSREALTGLGKVWLENQVQEYSGQAADLELQRSDVVEEAE